ncbi:MAG: SigE family RNA polymerase sigma factor [Acidothermaceae bacterium]
MNDQARDAFRSYVAARSPALLRMAYLLTGSRVDAEDLLQAALAKTYLSWESIRDRDSVDAYVRKVMVNTRTSWWRRRRHVAETMTDDVPERPSTADPTTQVVMHDALWAALADLPTRQRATVVLRYYEDLSEAETAAVLGVSVGTVKSTTARALAKLRENPHLRDEPESAGAEPAGAEPAGTEPGRAESEAAHRLGDSHATVFLGVDR